jgi:hypothetical protein
MINCLDGLRGVFFDKEIRLRADDQIINIIYWMPSTHLWLVWQHAQHGVWGFTKNAPLSWLLIYLTLSFFNLTHGTGDAVSVKICVPRNLSQLK